MIDGIARSRLGLRADEPEQEVTRERRDRYLKRIGVTVVLIEEVRNVTGDFEATDQPISHPVDHLVFLRYLEVAGEIRKAIGVLKRRFGDLAWSRRRVTLDSDGHQVGNRMNDYHGGLTGRPERASPDGSA